MKTPQDDAKGRWEAAGAPRGPVIVNLADVVERPVVWLWPRRIPRGKVTMLAGDPGLGKSFIVCDLAARVSTGCGWPDDPGARDVPRSVLLLSAEDDASDTIKPRLVAAGADCGKIKILDGVRREPGGPALLANLRDDLEALEAALDRIGDVALLAIDPISAYLGGVDSHENAAVRGLLGPLKALAERRELAVVVVQHLNKAAGGKAVYRASGSLAFIAAARAAHLVIPDPEDPERRLMLPAKLNVGKAPPGLAFRIETSSSGAPVIVWNPEPVTITADEALALESAGPQEGGKQADAKRWLVDALGKGPRLSEELFAEAKAAGFSRPTLFRARKNLGVVARKRGVRGPWEWRLAQPNEFPGEGSHRLDAETETLGRYDAENAQESQISQESQGESVRPFAEVEAEALAERAEAAALETWEAGLAAGAVENDAREKGCRAWAGVYLAAGIDPPEDVTLDEIFGKK